MVKLLSYFIVQFADYTYFITRGVFLLEAKAYCFPQHSWGFYCGKPTKRDSSKLSIT